MGLVFAAALLFVQTDAAARRPAASYTMRLTVLEHAKIACGEHRTDRQCTNVKWTGYQEVDIPPGTYTCQIDGNVGDMCGHMNMQDAINVYGFRMRMPARDLLNAYGGQNSHKWQRYFRIEWQNQN